MAKNCLAEVVLGNVLILGTVWTLELFHINYIKMLHKDVSSFSSNKISKTLKIKVFWDCHNEVPNLLWKHFMSLSFLYSLQFKNTDGNAEKFGDPHYFFDFSHMKTPQLLIMKELYPLLYFPRLGIPCSFHASLARLNNDLTFCKSIRIKRYSE